MHALKLAFCALLAAVSAAPTAEEESSMLVYKVTPYPGTKAGQNCKGHHLKPSLLVGPSGGDGFGPCVNSRAPTSANSTSIKVKRMQGAYPQDSGCNIFVYSSGDCSSESYTPFDIYGSGSTPQCDETGPPIMSYQIYCFNETQTKN